MAHLYIAATQKSSGKTTVTTGLAAAFSRQGLTVQPFKKGPDYIDPLWLGRAAGRACRNLDFHTQSEAGIVTAFQRHDGIADLSLIEGNKGLYDGVDPAGSDSNAALAGLLGAPVVLVIDTRGITRGIAPLVLGYQTFDEGVRIAGVILNRVGGPRHEGKLRAALERYTDVPVLGAVARETALEIPERHLGLVPANELGSARETIDLLAQRIGEQVDLDRLREIAASAEGPRATLAQPPSRAAEANLRIGIARDAAFGFYYPDDLEALEAAGAVLVPFDTMADAHLPEIDALFIGGGFPETHMAALEANTTLRAEIRAAIEAGMPAYAECGGLMYLSRSLTWRGKTHAMAGAIPGDAVMHDRPQGRGYVLLEETGDAPWPGQPGTRGPVSVPAHEFHYASLENLPGDMRCAWRVLRGHGLDGQRDGIIVTNLLASFCHLRDTDSLRWASRFVAFARQLKRGETPAARHSINKIS